MATAVHKKQTESKYVTFFADSRPDVDVTFRDVLLSRPTDHYLVGIDNFSMTNTSLSMIEPVKDLALIRIVKRLKPSDLAPDAATGSVALDILYTAGRAYNELIVDDNHFSFEISSMESILSVQQLMHRLGDVASDVNRYMHESKPDADYEYGGYTAAPNEDTEHLEFELATDGRLKINGTGAFWSCFCIEVPSVQNQFGFWGTRAEKPPVDFTRLRRFLALNPKDATPTFVKIQANPTKLPSRARPVQKQDETAEAFAGRIATWEALLLEDNAYNKRTLVGEEPKIHMVKTVTGEADTVYNKFDGAKAQIVYSFSSLASIFSSLERRIALEVGCSLPVKNSPMVDHQKESPDFVLGRWIWRTDPRIESNDKGGSRRYHSNMPACTEYQGAQDRISYHELQPQAKIQTLRIKLFARVRSFDELSETYSMRVIDLPTSATDWWHTRVHFMSKD